MKLSSLLTIIGVSQANDDCNRDYRVLVPLYVWPAGGTTETCGNADYLKVAESGATSVAIVNIANGEGSSDPWERNMFRACFQALKDGGNTVIAYIHSGYGQRALSAIQEWSDERNDQGFKINFLNFILPESGIQTNAP